MECASIAHCEGTSFPHDVAFSSWSSSYLWKLFKTNCRPTLYTWSIDEFGMSCRTCMWDGLSKSCEPTSPGAGCTDPGAWWSHTTALASKVWNTSTLACAVWYTQLHEKLITTVDTPDLPALGVSYLTIATSALEQNERVSKLCYLAAIHRECSGVPPPVWERHAVPTCSEYSEALNTSEC